MKINRKIVGLALAIFTFSGLCFNSIGTYAAGGEKAGLSSAKKVGKKSKIKSKNKNSGKFGFSLDAIKYELKLSKMVFEDRELAKTDKKPMFLAVKKHKVGEEVVTIADLVFSPTYLIEEYGLKKFDDFSKYSIEIVDEETGLVNRIARRLEVQKVRGLPFYTMPIVVNPIVVNPYSKYDISLVNFSDGYDGKFKGGRIVQKGFKFKPKKTYTVNIYSNSNFNKESLVVSCKNVKAVSVRDDFGVFEYATKVGHPDRFNYDYYSKLMGVKS